MKLAAKLDAVLRKFDIDLSAVADTWNAPVQPLGLRQGLKVELARRRDGTWRFSRATVEQIPQLFQPFSRLDLEPTTRGAGIGLSLVRQTRLVSGAGAKSYRAAATRRIMGRRR